ncbi:MAG: hypothetical protein E7049_09180 [Lentisphaerae bacterium]|nr:hypothetical protein [Lentisphaerota bacterium]
MRHKRDAATSGRVRTRKSAVSKGEDRCPERSQALTRKQHGNGEWGMGRGRREEGGGKREVGVGQLAGPGLGVRTFQLPCGNLRSR